MAGGRKALGAVLILAAILAAAAQASAVAGTPAALGPQAALAAQAALVAQAPPGNPPASGAPRGPGAPAGQPPPLTDLLWQAVAALTTLAIFSFLLGDNRFYKFVERLWVGLATGYWTMVLFHNGFRDKVWVPIVEEHRFYYLIPTALGVLMWLRLSPKLGWVSRYALAFYIGIATGITIPLTLKSGVFLQAEGAMRPVELSWAGLNYVLAMVGLICSLSYFFFSKAHKGLFGGVSRVGIYTLMVGFGAGFGLTVMGRVALLVQRVLFLRDFAVALWGRVF